MSPKVKVAQIAESTTAGVRRHLFDLVMHLDRERFSVSVIAATLRDPGFLTDIAAMNQRGVRVTIVPMRRNIHPVSDVLSLFRIRRALLLTNPDIVHTHSSKGGFLGRLAARMAHVPVVIHTPHVFPFEMDVSRPRRALYRFLESQAARWTNRFICVSGDEYARATSSGLADPAQFTLIENGIEADRPPTAPDPASIRAGLGLAPADLVVGAVGRLTQQKGLPDLIRAARTVVARVPTARFLLVGDGEMKPMLLAMVEAQGLRSHFVFAGSREDVLSLYPAMDVFAMPSLWESLPYALLEAMAAGNAVVATKVGGIPGVITHGQHGLLVPPGDSGALAGAILRLLDNAGERKTLGAEAQRHVRARYRLDAMIQSTQDLYLSSSENEFVAPLTAEEAAE